VDDGDEHGHVAGDEDVLRRMAVVAACPR